MPIKELCRKSGFSDATFYKWRSKYGHMDVPDARRLPELEGASAKLKRTPSGQLLSISPRVLPQWVQELSFPCSVRRRFCFELLGYFQMLSREVIGRRRSALIR